MVENAENIAGRDDLLLLIAKGAEDAPYAFDAIRAMKSCFVVSQRGLSEWRQLYDFRPYDYGPFDASVYRSRDSLVAKGLLEVLSDQYDACRLTDAGRERAEVLKEKLGDSADWLERVGRWASSRSFAQLLREVYAEYPDFAARSIARIA